MPAFDEPMSEPAADGRPGGCPPGASSGCAPRSAASRTVPEDHGNCSVGRFTHGLASLEEVGGNDDVAALLESGWVDAEAVGHDPLDLAGVPTVITYGPVAEAATTPDVVLLRVNGRQMMVLSDALPGLKIEGKPQCHIVALAKEHGEVAASVGCALSRARTGMRPDEMTLALPGSRLAEVTEAVERDRRDRHGRGQVRGRRRPAFRSCLLTRPGSSGSSWRRRRRRACGSCATRDSRPR